MPYFSCRERAALGRVPIYRLPFQFAYYNQLEVNGERAENITMSQEI